MAVGEREGRAVIVSGGEDGTVRVWDLATGRPVGEPLRGHDGPVESVAVGELEGRAVIVSGGADGTVRVWDLATGRPVGEPLRGHDGPVKSVAVGELEGRAVIVSGGEDGTVRVWGASGEPKLTVSVDAMVLRSRPGSRGANRHWHLKGADGAAMEPDGSFSVGAAEHRPTTRTLTE